VNLNKNIAILTTILINNMFRKGFLLCILPLLLKSGVLPAQDPTFSQFNSNRIYLNPALAGIAEGKRMFLNYRNQYPGLDNPYVTYSASYDQYVEPVHGGIGFSIMNDVQGNGSLNQFNLSSIYSYHFQVNRNLFVNAGLQVSFYQRKLSASKFIFGDQIDPITGNVSGGSESYGDLKKDFLDFSTGFSAFYKDLYGGISFSHLSKPVQSFSSIPDARLHRKFILYMGGCFPIYEKRFGKEVLQVNPNFIYIQQKNLSQLIYGLETLLEKRYALGFLVRQNLGIRYSAIILSAGLAFEKFSIRYSYDSQLKLPSVSFTNQGAHEISLIITIAEEKKINRKTIKCPKF
jgi:type IX secretion system PorP/SprF family membrane protein